MRANIEQLKKDITDAKHRQTEANKDIKRIEKDMSEFSDNKDSKLAELQSSLNTLKKNLSKNSVSVKELQRELQSSRLDSEQVGSDLSAAEEQLSESENTLKAQADEIDSLKREQARLKVSFFIVKQNYTHPRRLITFFRTPTISLKPSLMTKGPS